MGAPAAGAVGVVQGRITVEGGRASIAPGPGVVLLIDGEPVSGWTQITPASSIEVRLDPPHAGKLKLEVSEDQLEARLRVWPRRVPRLKDAAPREKLVLEVELEEEPAFSPREIEAYLREHGISYGIIPEAVERAARSLRPDPILIARGRRPGRGRDAWIEKHFGTKVTRHWLREDGTADYRAGPPVDYVEEGELLCTRHPPETGEPGMTVYGREVPARRPRDVKLVAGPGVRLEGDRAYADRAGRPVLRGGGARRVITVLSVLTHYGDVDITTGHLEFRGDIEIRGDVTEAMRVISEGEVRITGNVTGAEVRADGNVYINGNVINSQITAGQGKAAYGRLAVPLGELHDLLGDLTQVWKELAQRGLLAGKPPGLILKALLEHKFTRIPPLAEEVKRLVQDESIEETIREVVQDAARMLIGAGPSSLGSVADYVNMVSGVQRALTLAMGRVEPAADLEVAYAQKSRLAAGGSVHITRRGAYNTLVEAGEDVRVRGVFRGGRIVAGRRVEVDRLGSEAGTPTEVSVPARGVITAHEVHENVVLTVGAERHRFRRFERGVRAYLGEDGRLRLS